MLLHFYNAKYDSYAERCYITSNPKLPNIATLLEPTICSSHIIASSTCISKQYLEALKSESDGDLVYSNIEDDDDNDDDDDGNSNGDGDGDGGNVNDNNTHLFA